MMKLFGKNRNVSMDVILERIEQADDLEISQVIQAVIHRYKRVSPEWEMIFLSLPRNDPAARKRDLDTMVEFLIKHEQ